MMRVFPSLLLTTILVCVPCWSAETPLFYAPFDGADQAVLAHGEAITVTAYTSMKGPFIKGVRRQARVLGGKNRCSFFVDDGFFPTEGTCSLWVSPEDWTPASSQHFVFFASFTFTEVRREYVRAILYKFWNRSDLTLLVQNTVAGKEQSMIQFPIKSWRQREWHHLAVTWDENRCRLFVDGKLGGECPATPLPAQGRWEIAVGTPYRGWLYLGKERSAIDEVTVWPRAMSATEIQNAYQAGVNALSTREASEGDQQEKPEPIEGNLALDQNGAFVLASSFKTYESLYPDNLVDGSDATAWQPFDGSLPQWLEVRWEAPLKVNEIILRQKTAGQVSAFSILGWVRDDWQLLRAVDFGDPPPQRDVGTHFETITTDRVRVVIRGAIARDLALTTFAVRGPEQPIIGPLRYRAETSRGKTNERVVLASVNVMPKRPRPGNAATIEVSLRPKEKLHNDYVFLLEIEDEPEVPRWSDFSVAKVSLQPTTPTSQWSPHESHKLQFDVYLPKHAPDGPTSARLKAFDVQRGAGLDILDAEGNRLDEVAKIDIRRSDGKHRRPLGGVTAHFDRGSAVLALGRQQTPPAAWAFTTPSYCRYHYYSQTGIHVYHVKTYPLTYDDAPEILERTCRHLDQRIRAVLRVDPEATFLINFDLRPSGAWLKRNPGERLVTAVGRLGPVSFSSRKYNEGVHGFIRQMFAYLRKQPYYDRIAGYLPMACGAPDSVMGGIEDNVFQKDRAKLTIGDYNPHAIREFQDWLRSKYGGSVAEMRKAWKGADLTFESARPLISELTREGVDGGVFRDPLGSAMTFDYAEWLSGVMGRFYSRLIKIIKQEARRPVLVGTYYGYNVAHLRGYNTPGPWLQNNNFDLHERLQDPNWDFFAAPTPYSNRRAGASCYTSFTYDSLRLHKKLLMNELDHRTFIAGPTTYGRLRSDRETDAVLKRDLAGAIIDGAGYWFADWSRGKGRDCVGFFMDPDILDMIEKTREIHEQALKRERRSVSEIAVFTSGRTMAYHDVYRAAPIYHNLIAFTLWDAMGRLGAPYDIYMLEDLQSGSIHRRYKLYVFLNTFFLTPEDRRAINDLKREGRTLLFFYAPGYVSRENGLRVSSITSVTGIEVAKKRGAELMQYQVTNTEHPIMKGLSPKTTCEVQPFDYAISRELHPPELGPVFYVDDAAATTLAKYPDERAALAVKDFRDWKSVYCAVPRMGSQLLRGIARYAGVHLYCNRDVVLKADSRLLMLHNGNEGKVQLNVSLPVSCKVVDAYTDEVMTQHGNRFGVTLPKIETRLYWLDTQPRPAAR